jgi:hypothetical protein
MKIGTKSLLFGAHQFLWHPFIVFLAWLDLYRRIPGWKIIVCIILHDIGYFGLSNMEGWEGKRHSEYSAAFVSGLFSEKITYGPIVFHGKYGRMVAFHSRETALRHGEEPSDLCWPDKRCVKYDPWWLYLPRVILSGEIHEYRKAAADAGLFPLDKPNREWYEWARERMIRKSETRDIRPPYQEGS